MAKGERVPLEAMPCAAIIIRAEQEKKARGLTGMSLEEIVEALGLSRSQAYARAATLGSELPVRGPGRPRKGKTDQPPAEAAIVSQLVLRFVMENPGSFYLKKERHVYSDDFKAFVLDLLSPGGIAHGLTAAQAAKAINIPVHTINSWRANGRRRMKKVARQEPKAPLTLEDNTPIFSPEVERLLALYREWRGNFSSFCASLPGHGIHLSAEKVAQVLDLAEVRPRKRRNRYHVDAETLRGGLERFFANAQLCEDGKNVAITMGDSKYVFSWQVMVDMATNAVVGFDIRNAESGEGFLNALEQAAEAAGEPPLAAMRDRRKCNVSNEVEASLGEQGIESILTPKRRPQTNGPAENLFSLLTQSMPDIVIDDGSPEELAKSLLWYILTAFVLGRNMAPRKVLKGLTPGEAFDQRKVDEEERQQAREKLKKRAQDSRKPKRRGGTRKEDPVATQLVKQELERLSIQDPGDKTAVYLSKLGEDVASDSLGILNSRLEGGFDPNCSKTRISTGNRHQPLDLEDYLVQRIGQLEVGVLVGGDHPAVCLRITLAGQDDVFPGARRKGSGAKIA